MINSLILGNKTFPVNIIQGPLAGISCAPFRLLTWQQSHPAFTCSEMISCKTLIHQPKLSHHRYVMKYQQEGPVCYQLSGSEPQEIAVATKIVTDYGADLIDLNCGCPVNKIRNKGAGSRLLTDASKLYQLITAMKKNTTVPVSIKIRVENNSKEKFNEQIVKVVQDAGVDFLIVHGRHWTEHYETPCNHDQIHYFVEQLSIPVIGNGDIACINSLKKMFATGCAGVMISRAGVGQPWLIGKLISEINNDTYSMPSSEQIKDLFLQHVQYLSALLHSEKFAILQARKFAKYYARSLGNRAEFCAKINVCDNLPDLKLICEAFFKQ